MHTRFSRVGCVTWDEWNKAGRGAERMCGYCRTLMCGRHRAEIGQCVCVKHLLVRYCPTEVCFLLLPKDNENSSCSCSLAGNHTAQVEHL